MYCSSQFRYREQPLRYVAGIQRFLCNDYCDSFNKDKSFMYGRSISNQRIEIW